jgi:hypothetical protein
LSLIQNVQTIEDIVSLRDVVSLLDETFAISLREKKTIAARDCALALERVDHVEKENYDDESGRFAS